ncbi:MAG: hypothetical protein ACM3ML_05300 [Micromonosporaceae bacterium]
MVEPACHLADLRRPSRAGAGVQVAAGRREIADSSPIGRIIAWVSRSATTTPAATSSTASPARISQARATP